MGISFSNSLCFSLSAPQHYSLNYTFSRVEITKLSLDMDTILPVLLIDHSKNQVVICRVWTLEAVNVTNGTGLGVQVISVKGPPMMAFHYVNAWESSDAKSIIITAPTYKDPEPLRSLSIECMLSDSSYSRSQSAIQYALLKTYRACVIYWRLCIRCFPLIHHARQHSIAD